MGKAILNDETITYNVNTFSLLIESYLVRLDEQFFRHCQNIFLAKMAVPPQLNWPVLIIHACLMPRRTLHKVNTPFVTTAKWSVTNGQVYRANQGTVGTCATAVLSVAISAPVG